MLTGNQLLARLSRPCEMAVRRHADTVSLVSRQVLQERNTRLQHVYLIESGMASMVAKAGDGRTSVEVRTLGVHDFIGLALLHGVETSPHRCTMRVAGKALRIHAEAFETLIESQPEFRKLLLRYSHDVGVHSAQLIACNTKHSLRQRLARWLLVASERLESDCITITHDGVSRALAVRRAGITTEMGRMEQAGLIRRGRGAILIQDRAGLEKVTCGCHRILGIGGAVPVTMAPHDHNAGAECNTDIQSSWDRASVLTEPT